jgi:hypothetical protein
MDKSSTQLGVSPVGKVSPLSAAASIGTPVQTLESRASNLAHQQAALAAHLTTSNGLQKLVSTTHVSATAHLIDQSLQQAEAPGVSQKYLAQAVLTQTPNLPDVVSQQLKAAISQSGLFYESHLKDFAEGHRSLAEIKQEPQNKPNYLMQTLLPQQLHILEQQRLSWYGEVWSNQQMDWDVYVKNKQDDGTKNSHKDNGEQSFVASDLTLHLPHLGKVTAKISIHDGRMRIGFLAEQPKALQLLKTKSALLVNAIESNGQTIESLTLNNTMEVAQDG